MVIGFVLHGSSCCFCLRFFASHHIRRLLCVQVQGYVCVCTVGNVCKSKVCYHPHPTQRYVCVQLGMFASPRYGTIPTPHTPTHPDPKVRVCVCACSWECMQVQGMLPTPPHTPTHPNPKACVCTAGNVCKSKVCYHPHPTNPPTPTQRYVCVYRWVPKNTLCVQMSQICVRRWVLTHNSTIL